MLPASYFNPRSPHGERHTEPFSISIAIHQFQSTLPARGATDAIAAVDTLKRFQSTLPARGATLAALPGVHVGTISIHAPRTGSDWGYDQTNVDFYHFNPRSPHGERLLCGAWWTGSIQFQSTLPARGATGLTQKQVYSAVDFNPRSPHGERRQAPLLIFLLGKFQSTLPARGATL